MGCMVIACYRARAGKDAALLALVREHVPALRARKLATERAALAMRAKDGTIVEVFEWVSRDAIDRAHTDTEVQALWQRFGEACEYRKLADLAESREEFAHFEPL